MPGGAVDDGRITALAMAGKAGDRAATAAFIEATQAHAYRFLVHLAGPADAEDLLQETYLRAMRSLSGFAGRSSARTWLLAIARRVVVDHIRAATVRPRVAAAADWQAAADHARSAARSGFEDEVLLQQLLAALPDDRREALVLTQMLGLSYLEASLVCDCPVGTIRSRVARARTELAEALDEALDEAQRPARHLRASG